jgi:hypothetical protein
LVEAAIYRYWESDGRGVGFYIWVKGRERLDSLSAAIGKMPDEPPGPEESWDSGQWDNGTYYLLRDLKKSEIGQVGLLLREFVCYCARLLEGVGGVAYFVQ